jgi:DnaJ family protein A protein 2
MIVIRGEGMPVPGSHQRGDMVVTLSVKLPDHIDPALLPQLDRILPPRAPTKEFPHSTKFEEVEIEDYHAYFRRRYWLAPHGDAPQDDTPQDDTPQCANQ